MISYVSAGKARADIEIVVKSKESKKPDENPFNAINDQGRKFPFCVIFCCR